MSHSAVPCPYPNKRKLKAAILLVSSTFFIGAAAHAYLNKPVEELYVSLYLDRYDESLKKWKQVDYADFEYTAEEYPDGVDDPAIDITFLNQKKGYYYRIRGGFTASDGEKVEGFGPRTDGIWIE